MLAEDNDVIRLLFEDILSIGKHELVYQAKDGSEAVEKYASIKPDILLMDLTMHLQNHYFWPVSLSEESHIDSVNVDACSCEGLNPHPVFSCI